MNVKTSYKRHYEKWHRDDLEHRRSMSNHYKALFNDIISGIKRGACLDMGCGMGFMLDYLMEVGFNPIVGYDRDEEQVAACLRHGLDVLLSENVDEVLAKFPGPYALITALDFLEHLKPEDALTTVRSACAALDSDGVFLCVVPNANAAHGGRWRYIDYTHRTSFTEHSLDYLLYNAGFTDITIVPGELKRRFEISSPQSLYYWLAYVFFRGFRRLEMIAELGDEGKDIPLSLNILAIAKK